MKCLKTNLGLGYIQIHNIRSPNYKRRYGSGKDVVMVNMNLGTGNIVVHLFYILTMHVIFIPLQNPPSEFLLLEFLTTHQISVHYLF
jgi:hypothetical protein